LLVAFKIYSNSDVSTEFGVPLLEAMMVSVTANIMTTIQYGNS